MASDKRIKRTKLPAQKKKRKIYPRKKPLKVKRAPKPRIKGPRVLARRVAKRPMGKLRVLTDAARAQFPSIKPPSCPTAAIMRDSYFS